MDPESLKSETARSSDHLEKLLEMNNQFTKAKCEQKENISKFEKENEELRKRLKALQETKEKMREENLKLKEDLECLKNRERFNNVCKTLCTIAQLGGYFISDDATFDKETRVHCFKCHNYKDCYVTIEVSSTGIMNLKEIVPHHPNFQNIQEHFLNTQDSVSLLSNLRKYFSAMGNRSSLTLTNDNN